MRNSTHPAAAALAAMMKKPATPVFDSASEDMLDGSPEIDAAAVAAVQEFAKATDLDEGEGPADRLFAMLAGIADADMDGEIGDDEAEVLAMAANAAADYMVAHGVTEADAVALLEEWDNDVAARIQELLAGALPEDEDADMDAFAFGDEKVMDATYRKRLAVRGGKKVRINKRVSGTVRLSAKQKVAVRKMLRKSNSARAKLRRAKSMKIRRQTGL